MHKNIETFMSVIRASPEFTEASKADRSFEQHLVAIERCCEWGHQAGDMDAAAIEIFDEIARVAGSKHLSIKVRLLEIGRLAARIRDLGRSVQ